MYVRWKTLMGLGVLLWTSLCLYDAYFNDQFNRYNELDSTWLNDVPKEEILLATNTEIREDDIKFNQETFFPNGFPLIFWNVLTFAVTAFACTGGRKLLISCISKARSRFNRTPISTFEVEEVPEIEVTPRKSGSKIPVPVGSKTSTSNIDDFKEKSFSLDGSCTSLLTGSAISLDATLKQAFNRVRADASSEHFAIDIHSARLREEIMCLQEKSVKENAALSRKIVALHKEKRDIGRQLSVATKESRAAKEQLVLLLGEREMLIKRLDSASCEFKVNTKSKKMALAKLEASQETITNLRQELDKILEEKEVLENKYNTLEKEHIEIKERLYKIEQGRKYSGVFTKREKEHVGLANVVLHAPVQQEPTQKVDLQDIAQSYEDVQKVQERLQNLEKGLDRLKLLNFGRKSSTVINNDNLNNVKSSITIQTHSEPPENEKTGHVEKSKPNLTDEQRLKPLNHHESSGDESQSFVNQPPAEDPFERVGILINSIKRSQSPTKYNYDAGHSTEVATSENAINTSHVVEEEDSEDWESLIAAKNRMVSNSPQFQRFLKKNMEPTDRKRVASSDKTNIIF